MDVLDAAAECLDVQHLADEEVADVAGGPEVLNTGPKPDGFWLEILSHGAVQGRATEVLKPA